MSERLPYEESLNQQLNDLPMPDEQKSWEQMEKLLNDEDDDRVVPPVFLRGCLGWVLAGALALVALWFVVRPERRWLNHSDPASTAERGVKPGAPVPPVAPTPQQPVSPVEPNGSDTSATAAPRRTSSVEDSLGRIETAQPGNPGTIKDHPVNTPGTQGVPPLSGGSARDGRSHTVADPASTARLKGKENSVAPITRRGPGNRRKSVSGPQPGAAGGDTVLIRDRRHVAPSPNKTASTRKGRKANSRTNTAKIGTNKNGIKKRNGRTDMAMTNFKKGRIRNGVPETRNNSVTIDNPKRTDSLKKSELLRKADSVKRAGRLETENIKRTDSLRRTDSLKQVYNLKRTDSLKKIDSLKKLNKPQPKDSSAKPVKPEQKKSYYLSAGIGLQQQIPIEGQQATPYNYYGRKGSLADYIPSVYLRLHRDERWFIQGEFRYGAPQLIKEFTYSTQSRIDSGLASVTTTSLRLKKTFYHQLPLSFNYYVLPHWSVGTGIMYSRFRGAISEQQVDRTNSATQRDTILVKTVIKVPASSDSLFTRSQVHMLFQTEYTWRRLSLSLRYTRGLQPFIRYTDPGRQQREQKAQSFEALLRFRVWRSKKK